MPSPTSTPQPADTEFDPLVFWIKHQKSILIFCGLLVVALLAYALSEYVHNKRTVASEAQLANAHSVEDYRKVISDYSGSMSAGDAYLMLAEKLRAEGKLDESSTALHTFIDKYPEHPLISGAWTSLATNLEAQGKLDEALNTYQKVTTAYANSFSAPLAVLAQARILVEKGKTEDGRRLYEKMLTEFPGNFATAQAQEELRKLKMKK